MSERPVAGNTPFAVEVEKGKTYDWCACGRSLTQPWCDGSHEGSGVVPRQFTAKYSEKVWLCGCKRSRHAPFCDGAHNRSG
ncbi:MAG: iron-sulfur protein [Nevskia sp.]|nr:iron-sulfur protein [Nevskia sp.]